MLYTTEGLILRETKYKDSDKLLTILTPDLGKITALVRGGSARKTSLRAGTQLFSYSDITLFSSKGRYSLNEAEPKELFMGLRSDILRLSLGSFICEALEAAADEDAQTPGILRMGLNSLYALSCGFRPNEQIKAAFELRLSGFLGYLPDLSGCRRCGRDDPEFCVFFISGHIECDACSGKDINSHSINRRTLNAMRHVLSSRGEKFLSFTLNAEDIESLSRVCEAYFLAQTGAVFRSLDFYKTLGSIPQY